MKKFRVWVNEMCEDPEWFVVECYKGYVENFEAKNKKEAAEKALKHFESYKTGNNFLQVVKVKELKEN